MRAGGEEVGDDDDAVEAPGDQQIGSLFQAGTTEFQEGGFDNGAVADACEVCGCRADGLVGRLDSGAVGEDNDSSGHALDRKSTRLNSSHLGISYAVFCL